MVEQDVIGHLIDVERQASDLLLEAESEAAKLKASAKDLAEQDYRKAYTKIVSEIDAVYADGTKKTDESRDIAYREYDEHLSVIKKDQRAFNKYLDSLFLGQ